MIVDPIRQKLEAVWRYCGDALLVVEAASGRIVDANPEAERLFGRSQAELCGMDVTGLYSAEHAGRAGSHFGETAGRFDRHLDIDVVNAEGFRIPVELRVNGFLQNGRLFFLGGFRDVSERQRLAWALTAITRGTGAAVGAATDDDLMRAVCEGITEGSIFTLAWIGLPQDDEARTVRIGASAGSSIGYLDGLQVSWRDDEHGRGPTGRCIRLRETQINNDALTNPMFQPWAERAARHGIAASLAVPLLEGDHALGALTIYAKRRNVFSPEEVRLFEELARNLAFAITSRRAQAAYRNEVKERERQAVKQQRALEQMVAALASTIERRDPYTAGHQKRVAGLAQAIARDLDLGEDVRKGAYFAALVHDIGKIQVPTDLLTKPGRISAIEFELIKTHVVASYEILSAVDFPWPLADIAGQHHERLDGSGYPHGIGGDAIRIEARIIAVADVLEAITSHRPYRPALGLDAGLSEIRRQRGIKLDATIVDSAVRLCTERGFRFPDQD
ncbi:MAG: GAF domain-containing protein [Magnetospirillum sp.]|nr:GAF domain-containing protein [Magnetospirillum sp.]